MKFKILTALLFAATLVTAQETETIYSNRASDRPMNMLIKSDKGFGGHLSLNVKGSEVYDEMSVLVGGELVFTLNHALNVGVAGYGMPSRVEYNDPENFYLGTPSVEMAYGGFFVEPVFFDQQVVHFTVPVLIGAGWSALSDSRYYNNPEYDDPFRIIEETGYFVFEPGINMEVNLARNVKFTLGGSYRMISGVDFQDAKVTDSDLSGFAFSGGIRVGWF